MLSHNNLTNYYKLIFNMAQHHGYNIENLENLIPFELDLYSNMLIDYLEQKKQEQEIPLTELLERNAKMEVYIGKNSKHKLTDIVERVADVVYHNHQDDFAIQLFIEHISVPYDVDSYNREELVVFIMKFMRKFDEANS